MAIVLRVLLATSLFCTASSSPNDFRSLSRRSTREGGGSLLRKRAARLVGGPDSLPQPPLALAQVGATPPNASFLQLETREVPLTDNSPESLTNLEGYEIAQPTPRPAPFGGQYCRGHSCAYRVTTPPPVFLPTTPFPNTGYGLNNREFCRGLGCIPMMGWPSVPGMDPFNLLCSRLFDYIGGGLKGDPSSRTIADVRDSWVAVCKTRVGPLEIPKCAVYADVVIAAMAPAIMSGPPVGDTGGVCTNIFLFKTGFNQARIDLKLTPELLPGAAAASASLLETNKALNRFGTGGVGPNSPRGRRWKDFALKHHRPATSAADSGPLDPMGNPQPVTSPLSLLMGKTSQWPTEAWSGATKEMSLVETVTDASSGCRVESEDKATAKEPWTGVRPPPGTYTAQSLYRNNPPCAQGAHIVPKEQTMYQIAPGAPDGTAPPVETPGDLFKFCNSQFGEIMMGFSQTPKMTIQMTKDWCSWQSSVTSWIGQRAEFGHPDWDSRSCTGMASLVAFALRDISDSQAGIGPQGVCAKIFLSIGAIKRVTEIIDDVWSVSLRGAPTMTLTVAAVDDEAMAALMAAAQEYASQLYGKMRSQASAFATATEVRMDTAAFDPSSIQAAPPVVAPPALPSSDDFQALIATGEQRLRRWGDGRD